MGIAKRPILHKEEDEFGLSWKNSYLPENFVFPTDYERFVTLDKLLMELQIAVENWHRTVLGVAENKGIAIANLSLFDPRSSISDYILRDDQEHNCPARIQTWSTTCLAPLDLMRYTSHRLQHGDSDELALLLSIASGWVSANNEIMRSTGIMPCRN